jgi:hypothetical protein
MCSDENSLLLFLVRSFVCSFVFELDLSVEQVGIRASFLGRCTQVLSIQLRVNQWVGCGLAEQVWLVGWWLGWLVGLWLVGFRHSSQLLMTTNGWLVWQQQPFFSQIFSGEFQNERFRSALFTSPG